MALDLQNLKNKITSAKDMFANALFGVPAQTEGIAPNVSYGEKVDKYLSGLGSQPYMQGLLNQPKETGLTLDQYKQGVANGLNYGVPEIAQAQKELGINIPKTGEEINLANVGQLNLPTGLSLGTATTPRQGGFFNDLAKGYEENLTQKFDFQNLAPDKNKNFATRLGEGVGSLVSFYNKPIARGLLGAAAALALGGGAGGALAMGLGTTVARQRNMTKDSAYRQNLQQMGYTQEEIDSIPGIVNDQVYTNLIRAQQLRDNAEYRNMLLENQQANTAAQLEFQRMKDVYDRAQKEKEFNYRASQDAFDNKIALANLEAKKQGKENKNIGNLNAVNTQLKRFEESFASMPGKLESNTLGRIRNATGFQTEQEANFNSQRQLLFNKIARDLGGEKGVLSDQDIKRIEGALPSYTDSLEQKNAKMSAIYDLLNDRLSVEGGSIGEQSASNDPLGIL